MAWPGMAWPLLACQILSFVKCKNVSRDAETKTYEVLKSWELENKELCLHHTTGIKSEISLSTQFYFLIPYTSKGLLGLNVCAQSIPL